MPNSQFVPVEALDDRQRRNNYWARIRKARTAWEGARHRPSKDSSLLYFYNWLEAEYGVRVHTDGGYLTEHFTVTDEQKYALFLLKFG